MISHSPTNLASIIKDWLLSRKRIPHHKVYDKTVFSIPMQSFVSDWIVCACTHRLFECRINTDNVEVFKEEYGAPSRFIYAADPQFFNYLEIILKKSCSKKSL